MKAWVARRLRELALAGDLGRSVERPARVDGETVPAPIDRPVCEPDAPEPGAAVSPVERA